MIIICLVVLEVAVSISILSNYISTLNLNTSTSIQASSTLKPYLVK